MRPALSLLPVLLLFAAPAVAERLTLVAGGGAGEENVPATAAKLNEPFATDFDDQGNLYIAEHTGGRILKVDKQGLLTRFAGDGQAGNTGDGGPALAARFDHIHHILVHGRKLLVADTGNHRIRQIDLDTGVVSALFGTGEKGYTPDNVPGAQAKFGGVYSLSLSPRGDRLAVADLDNRRIRTIDLATGQVKTMVGNGERAAPKDGAVAASVPLLDPRAVVYDERDNVYIVERGGHCLRFATPKNRVYTVAGDGRPGFSPDGGDARQVRFNGPKHACLDRAGNVLIADTENHVIWKFLPSEKRVVRIAGTGEAGSAGLNGSPLEAQLARPHGVAIGPDGYIYIADSDNHRVVRIEP
jgi:sugar lactone lactonase YvrE